VVLRCLASWNIGVQQKPKRAQHQRHHHQRRAVASSRALAWRTEERCSWRDIIMKNNNNCISIMME